MSTCHINPKKLSTTKKNRHTPSGYSLFTHFSFDATKNRLHCYRSEEKWYDLFVRKINLIKSKKCAIYAKRI